MPRRMEFYRSDLSAAERWQLSGNVLEVQDSLSRAFLNLLAITVEEQDTLDEARRWLLANDAHGLLIRIHESLVSVLQEVDAGRVPATSYAFVYRHLVLAHIAWTIPDYPLGEAFISIALRKDNLEWATRFWREYARGLGALVQREPFVLGDVVLRGQERYWVTFLRLIEAETHGRPLVNALQEIDAAFQRRNSDRRIRDDNFELEGCGYHPIRWNFRQDSLLNYIYRR